MTDEANTRTRIMIGASSFADASAALRLIERVITEVRLNLGGLLVEEAVWETVCDLPNQRVISASGQFIVAPTRAQVSTLIDADARAFRSSLAKLAALVDAPWTFQRDVGDLIQTSLETAVASDILVFAHRHIHPVAGKIVLLSSATAVTQNAAAMSQMLARQLQANHVALIVGEHKAAHPDQSEHFETLEDALSRLARINAQAVFLDFAHGPIQTPEQLRHLLDVARCPAFVFEMGSAARAVAHSTQIPPAPGTRRRTRAH